MSISIDDPRIASGMVTQLAARRQKIAAGETPAGWKVGFGAKAAMEKLGISAPLVGYLMQSGEMESGGTVSLAGWTQPVAEPEVAVYVGRDLAGNIDEATAEDAIVALAPAIELADVAFAPEKVEAILDGNIFQRRFIVGEADRSRAGGSVTGLRTRVIRNGEEAAVQSALEANTGNIVAIVRHVAAVLGGCGERLKAGQFVIAGSITPPFFLDANDRELVHAIEGLGSVSVRFAHA